MSQLYTLTDELQFIRLMNSLHKEIGTRYSYSSEKPIEQREGYEVFKATHNDLGIHMTLKLIQNPSEELRRYLKRMKEMKVENVIKIYELFDNDEGLFITTEQVTFSNLKFALHKCKKLDDADAIFMSKVLLTTHVELMRSGFNWHGTEQDIEFTDTGLKVSWNNSAFLDPLDTQSSFPVIISRLAGKLQISQQKILPFPKNKIIQDLIAVSSQNASEIGLNTNMKRKQKISKKKGKDWLCLKESKVDFEYYEENVYFCVHREVGFARVKSYPIGKLEQDILNLNRTKNTFTKLIDTYPQQGKTYLVSEYSNDGTLFSYANRLKANSIALREEQIEFFFYSLFEPLKVIQESSIKSLCMLNIKNIYIENGIPKIGEPVPMNKDLREQLKDKADVPDFYHRDFKRDPTQKTNTYDTYSLGVLMYKLMYTEYPIFPQGKVHIPTTPAYNKRLKSTLEIFLNQGGMLKDLEKKIEVSDEVAKQVKLNKHKLLQQKKNLSGKRRGMVEYYDDEIEKNQGDKREDENTEGREQEDEGGQGCCELCCAQIDGQTKHKSMMLDSLQESPYSGYRSCTKILCIISLYVFLFYFFFLQNVFTVMSNHSKLERLNVTISTVNYEVTVADSNNFYTVFNLTTRSVAALVETGCFINNYQGSADYAITATASSYQVYTIFGLLLMITLLVFKMVQLAKFDLIKTLYNMSNLKSNFNMSNYIIFNLLFASFINNHYIFYNQIFNTIFKTCLGVQTAYYFGSTHTYFHDSMMFLAVFGVTLMAHFIVLLLVLIMLVKTDTIRYTRIFNPILLITPVLLAYWVIVRVGILTTYFYPSLLSNIDIYGKFFGSASYINILGILPEILFLFEFLIELLVDYTFWLLFDKKRRMMIGDLSSANIMIQ